MRHGVTVQPGQWGRSLLEAMAGGAAIVSGSGAVVDANSRWADLSGMPLGEDFFCACDRLGLAALACRVRGVITGESYGSELEFASPAPGSLCRLRAEVTPLEREGERLSLVRLVGLPDAGPRADGQEGQFRDMADAAGFMVWISDETGATTYVNTAWLKATGRSMAEELGDGWLEGVHPDDRERCAETYRAHFDRREPYEIEYRLRRSDRSYAWVLSRGAPRYDVGGRFAGFVGTCLDVSRRRMAEEAFRGVFDAVRDGIIVLDLSGRVVDANDAVCAMHGWSREEFVALEPSQLVHAESLSKFYRFLDQVGAGEPFRCQAMDLRRDGTAFDVEVHGARVMYRGRPHLLGVVRDVSEQRRAEEELKRLGEEMETVLRTFPVIFWRIDGDGTFVESVGSGLSALGLREGEAVGTNVFEEFPMVADEIRRAMAGETLTFFADGEYRGRSWCYQVFVSPDESAGSGIVGFSLDVTEQKRAERALVESERRLRDVAAQVPGVVYCYDAMPDGSRPTRFIGPGLEALLGERIAEEIRRDFSPLFARLTPEDREHIARITREHMREDRPIDHEYPLQADDGRWVWVRNLVRVECLESGVVRCTGVIMDITEKHRAEVALRESRELLDRTQTLAQIGGWKLDLASGQMTLTDEARRILGLEVPEAPGFDRLFGMCDDASARALREALARAADAGEAWDLELVLPHEHARCTRLRHTGHAQPEDGTPSVLWGTLQDVTRQRELEEELRHAQKMEAVGQLASGIAHEFNNLITAVRGHVDIARESLPPGSLAGESLEHVSEAMAQAFGLARGLLAFSRKTPARREPVEVEQIVEQARRLLQRSIPRRIDLRVRSGRGEAHWIMADQAQILHVVLNLALNARDAMPGGGTLTIEIEPETPCAAPPFGGPRVAIRVSDSGIGMPDDVRRRLFEPFFTTKPVDEGTGLGLTLSKNIVEDHAGEIRVASAPGAGTTMTVLLPLVNSPAHQDADAGAQAAPRTTVVLCEPRAFTRSLLTTMLDDGGFEVVVAGGPEEALAAAGPGDVVVLSVYEDVACMLGLLGEWAAVPGAARTILIAGTDQIPAGRVPEGVTLLQRPFRSADLAGAIRGTVQ